MGQRNSYGGPAVSETTRQIEAAENFVAVHRAKNGEQGRCSQ